MIPELRKSFNDEKEILESDFRDDVDIDREQLRLFSRRVRGSVRIRVDLVHEDLGD